MQTRCIFRLPSPTKRGTSFERKKSVQLVERQAACSTTTCPWDSLSSTKGLAVELPLGRQTWRMREKRSCKLPAITRVDPRTWFSFQPHLTERSAPDFVALLSEFHFGPHTCDCWPACSVSATDTVCPGRSLLVVRWRRTPCCAWSVCARRRDQYRV